MQAILNREKGVSRSGGSQTGSIIQNFGI